MGMVNKFVLSLRKSLPRSIRQILRLGRHLIAHGQSSRFVPAELLDNCRMCASRNDLVKQLPRHSRVAEVGTYRGDFARHILANCEPAELHLIDLDFSLADAAVLQDGRVKVHVGQSHEVLSGFPNAYFDWVYIDADHSYSGVARDAHAAASKIRPGGFLVFNDFAHMDPYLGAYGVHRAVVDFAVANRWPFAWWAYDCAALYDVALRCPDEVR
jgi:hypothetical protein